MGMTCVLLAASAGELEAWQATSDDDLMSAWFGDEEVPGLVENDARAFHLEKLWTALDFVLTGTNVGMDAQPPLNFLRLDDDDRGLGPDLGYGPAKVLAPTDVAELWRALTELAPATIRGRLSSSQLVGVYPFSVGHDDDLLAAAQAALDEAPPELRTITAQELAGKVEPPNDAQPSAADRRELEECLSDLQAFIASVERDGLGLIVIVQ
jgi:hypothetical protein